MPFFVYLSHLLTKIVLKFVLTVSKNSAYQPGIQRIPVFKNEIHRGLLSKIPLLAKVCI